MVAALEWAAMHSVDSLDEAATVPGTDRALPIAGQGAPLTTGPRGTGTSPGRCAHAWAGAEV
jgi:hypothetical protein